MIIGIDYDGTWTADPTLWRIFHDLAVTRKHIVLIVTGRDPKWSGEMRHLPQGIRVIHTFGQLKEQACLAAGIKVDVWIDDMPGMIQECRIIKPSPDQEL